MTMGITRAKALEILELPTGADTDSIRTAYKRLAQKWHPDKYGNSSGAQQRFFEMTLAYKRLNTDNENVALQSKEEVYEIFNRTCLNKTATNGYSLYSDSDEDSSDDYDDDDDDDCFSHIYTTKHDAHRLARHDGVNNNTRKLLTPEEIERNAQELISEEEKEKRKAEKRRAKKKRQREKKKAQKDQKKEEETANKKKSKQKENGITSKKDRKKDNNSSGSEAEEFDQNAAFFQVVSKKKKGAPVAEAPPSVTHAQRTRSAAEARLNGNGQDEKVEDLDPVILRARQLAREGNQMASTGHYQSAIDLFTDACKLDSSDFRFFGNRSYCYDRIHQYEKALKDADKAINLAPEWPKGYFRKGRALAGLKLYSDAEQAFMQVLKLDKNCEDAMQELIRVRTHQLTEMGFTLEQAEQAITNYVTVQQALDSLLAGVAENSLANEIYESDEEDYGMVHTTPAAASVLPSTTTLSHHHHPATTTTAALPDSAHPTTATYHPATSTGVADHKMDPKNPKGLTALWVGNVLPEVTQAKLLTIFSKYGPVTSIRMLPEKYCAFVNFKTKEAAGKAMNGLQSSDCAGQKLLIKFPDNPINGNVVLRKDPSKQTRAASPLAQVNKNTSDDAESKTSGPVNGDECYFWRTTGCTYGTLCRYKHLPASRGVDKKPWQRTK